MASDFFAPQITTTFQVPMTFTSRLPKFDVSDFAPAIPSAGSVRAPKEGERYFALLKVEQVNFQTPEMNAEKVLFDNLTPLYPNKRIGLEHQPTVYSTRIIDMMGSAWQRPALPDRRTSSRRQNCSDARYRQCDHHQSS
ncbi:unnamed protein product [Sphagnum jensenii]|uniref:Rho RNA-BD domain-containing protein n=1 Tax=Sphagnum jensenii TaxID=128206 RepID=A0ABP0V9Z1_9BRYO